jgi:uncharacterized membrane protein YkoI
MKFALPLIFLFIITFTIEAMAQGNYASGQGRVKSQGQNKSQLKVTSSKQAAKIVKARFGGKVLKVSKKKSGYRVKLIKADGHIVYVYVDAKTGKVKGKR